MKEIPEIKKFDTMVFNELMETIQGDVPNNIYVLQNLEHSGMEFWRRMIKNNDPKTFGTIEHHMKTIRDLTTVRCKTMN